MSNQISDEEQSDLLSRKAKRCLVGWRPSDLWDVEVGELLTQLAVIKLFDPYDMGPKVEQDDLVQYYPWGDGRFTLLFGYYGKEEGWSLNIVKDLDEPSQQERVIDFDDEGRVSRVRHVPFEESRSTE